MKRILPVIFMALSVSVASAQFKAARIQAEKQGMIMKSPAVTPMPEGASGILEFIPGQKVLDETVGTSYYDLQSYNALEQRIYAYEDGTIGLTWMRAMETTAWSDRGTGYNYFDGSSWGPDPTSRIESMRTGWTCYAPFGPAGEIAISHSVIQSVGLILPYRTTKGSGAWQELYLVGPEGWDIVWPAMITNGPDHTYIHVLAVTYGDPYLGQSAALLYYRSLDGGLSWDIQHMLFDELNSDYFNGIDGNGYAWAAPRGDTIAFSVGFNYQDGCVMKSYDNGDTWDKIIAYDSPYTPYAGGETPTFGGGDATQAMALDSQGKAHVVFGRMLHVFDAEGTGFYYPWTEGIIYWNEDMPALDTGIISSYTLDYLEQGGNLIGWTIPYEGDSTILGFGTYYVSITSHPQIQIDDNDNIFVTWAGVAPGFDNMELNYRHILGNASSDGGITWSGPADYTNDILYIFSECMYPVMSPTFTGDLVHIAFISDQIPGLNVWTGEHTAVENSIIYTGIPLDDFLVGIPEAPREADHITGAVVYPNPSRGDLTLSAEIREQGHLTVGVLDISGRLVSFLDVGDVRPGQVTIPLEGTVLTPGVYFYRISLDGASVSGKLTRF